MRNEGLLYTGYEAARKMMPLELRPPHGPISPDLLADMVKAAFCAMVELTVQSLEDHPYA
jgi:hypothetical protein